MIMKHFIHSVAKAALVIAVSLGASHSALAAGAADKPKPEEQDWSFAGPFGTYDNAQLQRGFKVFRENCAACHALSRVAFRNLMEPGGPEFSEAAARQIASEYMVVDGPDAVGDMFEREAVLSDRFPSPFPNKNAAQAANGGAYPPDFSLLAKARAPYRGFPTFLVDIVTQYQEGGPDYIHALLTGYEDPPAGEEGLPGLYYNPYFLASDWIAMAPPLVDGAIEYTDGSPETVDQYSKDVAAFMMWAAEPHLEARKAMGFRVMLFLAVFAGLLYLTKRKVWSNVPH
jgi:ubiquinol-cytochrome c reductase cytochrome c1 subunit